MRRLAALLICLAVVATGCSGARGPAPAEPDRLTVALAKDMGPLNLFAGADEPIAELVYDKLLAPSPYVAEPKPWLATAVRQLDAANWEVDLREGVRWQDGRPFTADDVVFTFDYMKKAPTGRWTHHVSDIPTVSGVVAESPTKVRISCAFACPELGTVTLADLPIIPKHVWESVPPSDAKKVQALPIGTGPYKLVSYSTAGGYRFERFDDYFAGRAAVRELIMPVIPDPSATFIALSSGEIDAAARPVSPELINQFRGSGELTLVRTSPLQFPEMRINYQRAPMDQPRFREAVSKAINRDQLLTTVYLGQGRPATQGYPHPDAPFADRSLSTPYAPDQAKRLLDELGFTDRDGDGVREGPVGPLRFTLNLNGGLPTEQRAAELIVEDLGKVGIAVTTRSLDTGTLVSVANDRTFDLQLGTITAHGVADPDQFVMSHRSGYLWRAPALPYPEWDAQFERWKAAGTNAERLPVLQEMQRLFNRQPTSIPLAYPDEYYAFRSDRYGGWRESPGYGVVHKWSLLPADVAGRANAVVATRN